MGWFDSIIDGIGSAVNWTMANSGAISDAVNAVGTVAGLLASDSVDGVNAVDDDKQDLFVTFNRANAYLLNTAGSILQPPPKMDNLRTVQLSGLWTGASPIDAAGNPSPEMYKDIANFLVQNDIPLVLKGTPPRDNKDGPVNDDIDVALRIGQSIFADNAVPPPSPSSSPALPSDAGDPPSYINTPTVNLANHDSTCAITGVHAYYAIPLGKTGYDNAWHGAIKLSIGTTSQFDREHQAYKRQLRLVRSPEVSLQDLWAVTVQIAWTWVPLATQAYQIIKDTLKSEYPNYVIMYYTSDGQLQTIKIHAPPEVTPAQVRAAVSQAVATALAQLQKGSGVLTSTKTKGQKQKEWAEPSASALPQMPDIAVTCTTLLPGKP